MNTGSALHQAALYPDVPERHALALHPGAAGEVVLPGLLRRGGPGVRVGEDRRARGVLGQPGDDALRVRLHDDIARIEVPRRQLGLAIDQADPIVQAVKAAGFVYVTLDLAGLRSGSLLEVIQPSAAGPATGAPS